MRTQQRMHIQVKAELELDMCKYAIKFIAIPNAMRIKM